MIFINIGIDIGGSHVGMGLVDEEGNIKDSKYIFYTNETFSMDKVFASINDFIEEFEDEAESVRYWDSWVCYGYFN